MSFPSAQIAPGKYRKDSDAIISHYAEDSGIDLQRLPAFQEYVSGPFNTLMTLFKENRKLRKHAA